MQKLHKKAQENEDYDERILVKHILPKKKLLYISEDDKLKTVSIGKHCASCAQRAAQATCIKISTGEETSSMLITQYIICQ
jgi:hypothetical protein